MLGNKYSNITKLIEHDRKLLRSLTAVKNNVVNSYLVDEVMQLLEDGNIQGVDMSDSEKLRLIHLVVDYSKHCGVMFLTYSGIDKLADNAIQAIYKTDAEYGIRVSTESEVKAGVRGLIEEKNYLIDERKFKLLNLLAWTIHGRLKNYRLSGYRYRYDGEKKELIDSVYDLINKSIDDLYKLIEWAKDGELSRDTDVLRSKIKNKYKYPVYAADEVKEDMTIKQLLYYLENNIPRGTGSKKYNYAINLIIRNKENKYFRLSPIQISSLRDVYHEVKDSKKLDNLKHKNEKTKLQSECEVLIKAKNSGHIDKGHFVFKVINTIKMSNYNRCSEKQYNIISDALLELINKLNNKESSVVGERKKVDVVVVDSIEDMADTVDNTLVNISNALGGGAYE